MVRRTLIDFFADLSTTTGEFVVYDDGYRSWSYTYAQMGAAARAFAARLRAEAVTSGQAVAVWGENRAEWIIALWGCLLEGIVFVPIDHRASPEFLLRVASIVDARVVLVGDAVDAGALDDARPIWKLAELRNEPGSGMRDPGAGARGSGLGARESGSGVSPSAPASTASPTSTARASTIDATRRRSSGEAR